MRVRLRSLTGCILREAHFCHPERSEGSFRPSFRTSGTYRRSDIEDDARAVPRPKRSFASLRMTAGLASEMCPLRSACAGRKGETNVCFRSACCVAGRLPYPRTDRRRWAMRSRMPEVLPHESRRCTAAWRCGTSTTCCHCCRCCHAIRRGRHPLPAASRICRVARRHQPKSLTTVSWDPSSSSRASRQGMRREQSFYRGRAP